MWRTSWGIATWILLHFVMSLQYLKFTQYRLKSRCICCNDCISNIIVKLISQDGGSRHGTTVESGPVFISLNSVALCERELSAMIPADTQQ